MKDVAKTLRDVIHKMDQWQKKLAKGEGVSKIAEQMKQESTRLKTYLSNTEQ